MKTVGIIAEFNPFHNGHKYLIEQAKAKTGADCCVVIMSGDFVQRGAPAICNRYLRTNMALKSGADIVFELPAVYALGSAELFAEGAVTLLTFTGQIDYLCFGSESGDTDALIKCASIIEDYTSTPAFKDELSSYIKNGVSYPSAFSKALGDTLGNLQSLLYSPNNLLGIEYLKALSRLKSLKLYPNTLENDRKSVDNSEINLHYPTPLAIHRNGSEHFDTEITEYSSATAIRDYIINNDDLQELSGTLPSEAYKILSDNKNRLLPVTEDDFSNMLYMRLNTMSDDELFAIPDINPDLIHKLIDFRGKYICISDLIMSLKSKCFTYTAISRAIFRILLCPLYLDAIKQTDNEKPYLRLLGFNKNCSEFLRNLRNSELINIVTKPADGPLSDPSYKLDIYAANLYEQVCSNKFNSKFSEELKFGPIMF